jgi:aminoglycoside/choline kinase family phosphotransferase
LEASDSDFRYYPERRHSLLLQYLTKRANSGSGFPSSHEDGTQWAVRVIGIFVRVT